MYVVHLLHPYIVFGEAVHEARQKLVHFAEDGHAEGEVAGPEEGFPFLGAGAAHVGFVVGAPSCAAADHLHASGPSTLVVGKGSRGVGKFDGHIGTGEGGRSEIVLVVEVNDGNNLVAALARYFFDDMAHFAISY